ncbi:hypothetical protein HOA92_05620 [archaeon]|nr:hypothetical protein [archaeon]
MSEINHLLENIGLTKSEIKVYLALLELGSSSTGPIVDKSGAASSKIYEVLEKLIQKGLVSFVIKGRVKHFEAASPKRIVDYLKEKQLAIEEQTKSVQALLPELEMKQTLSKNKSETLVFKGLKGAQTAFDNILLGCKDGDEFVAMGFSDVDETFQNFLIRFHKKRVKRRLNFRAVFGPSLANLVGVLNAMPRSQVKEVPQMGNLVATLIYKDTVLFSMPKDRLWIQVTNQDLADTMMERFEGVWDQKIHIFEGVESIKSLFLQSLEFGNYSAFAEGMKVVNTFGEDFFVNWQNEKRRRKIKSRIIMGSQYQDQLTVTKAFADFKFIPGYENVGATLIFKDKVIQVNFTKKPTAFLIEDKDSADSQRMQFDQLWNQDTIVTKGWDALLLAMNSFVGQIKPGDTFDVIGAAFGVEGKQEKYAELFAKFDQKRLEKKVHARWLFQQGTGKIIKKNKLRSKNGQIKFLPYKNDSPVSIYPYKDKTLIMLQGEEPTTITINNKEITSSFHKQFDQLWNQETTVVKGYNEMLDILDSFIDEIEPGDTFDALGAAFGVKGKQEKYARLFEKFHIRRKKMDVHARWLFQQDTDKIIKKNKQNYQKGQIKYLPYKNDSPVSIYPYKNKTLIMLQGEEPTTITINNKEITQSFKKQFEQQWNQDTVQYNGIEGTEQAFFDALSNCKKGDDTYVYGASVTTKEADYLFYKYNQARAKKGVKLKIIFSEIAKNSKTTRSANKKYNPLADIRFTNDLVGPAVYEIFPDRVIITTASKKNLRSTVIKDLDLVESFKANFFNVWKNSKK